MNLLRNQKIYFIEKNMNLHNNFHHQIYLIDANVLLRYIMKDSTAPAHVQESRKFFDEIEEGIISAGILPWVIMEVLYVWTGVYNRPLDTLITVLIDIMKLPAIVNREKLHILSALWYMKTHNIDFVDSFLISKSKFEGYRIKTFDKKMLKIISWTSL